MSPEIATCDGCGHRRPVHVESGLCLACRNRVGALGGPATVATDGGDAER